ncbi:hypothetical protein CR513_38742, partial [Mucuna pruriens]
MEGNTYRTHFMNSYNPMALYLKGHAHQPHNKIDVDCTLLSSPSLGNEFPFTQIFGHPPDYFTLRIFGYVCYAHLPPQELILLIKRAFYVMILTFFEFGSLEMLSFKNILFFCNIEPPQDNSLVVAPIQEPKSATLRRSSRIRKPPKRYISSLAATLSSIHIPSSYKQAMEMNASKKLLKLNFLH